MPALEAMPTSVAAPYSVPADEALRAALEEVRRELVAIRALLDKLVRI
jgi:hypothetical protein